MTKQESMPFVKNTYRVFFTEEIGGYALIDASDEEEAEEKIEELVQYWGADQLLYPSDKSCIKEMQENAVKKGKQTHGERGTISVEYIQ